MMFSKSFDKLVYTSGPGLKLFDEVSALRARPLATGFSQIHRPNARNTVAASRTGGRREQVRDGARSSLKCRYPTDKPTYWGLTDEIGGLRV